MSHEVETMAYAGQVPWHGLGVNVEGDLTPEEMLVAAGLDWEVEHRRLYTLKSNLYEEIEIPNHSAIVRNTDDKVMCVASKQWTPLQNRDMMEFMHDYAAAGGLSMETAGSLNGGRIIWGLARLNAGFEVTPGDRVNGYLLISNSHAVGRAIKVQTTTVRVVCANTMAAAENSKATETHWSQNHLGEFDAEAAKERVGQAYDHLAAAERNAGILKQLKLSVEDACEKVYLPVFTPKAMEVAEERGKKIDVKDRSTLPPSIRKIMDCAEHGLGADPGTGWGALQGVTFYADHIAGHTNDSRMTSAWMGTNASRKQKAMDKLLELAS